MQKGTEILVVDNNNLCETDYLKLIKKAQQEHYFVSIVTLPPTIDMLRMQQLDKTDNDLAEVALASFLPKWEPNSPAKLYEKTH